MVNNNRPMGQKEEVLEMNRNIDFRKNGVQVVDLPFDGESRIEYVGKCPVTGVRLYVSDKGNDPRGPLGIHAVTDFVASEFGMTGPTLSASWIACNNDYKTYLTALDMAKKTWKGGE